MQLFKDLLVPKSFNVWGYVVALLYLATGITFTGITGHLRSGEKEGFRCKVDSRASLHQRFVEAECFSKYKQKFNSPFPLYGFVLVAFGTVTTVCVIYSFCSKSRVEEIENFGVSSDEIPLVVSGGNEEQDNEDNFEETRSVFRYYIVHLIVRFVLGVLFTVLQQKVFYPLGFRSDFICDLHSSKLLTPSSLDAGRDNFTSTDCHNSLAAETTFWATTVSVVNIFFAFLAFGEVIYLARKVWRTRPSLGFATDLQFCRVYLLGGRNPETADARRPPPNNDLDSYRSLVLDDTPQQGPFATHDREDVNVNCVIFRESLMRHKLMESFSSIALLKNSDLWKNRIPIQNIKELFLPNEDIAGKTPRTILLFDAHSPKMTTLGSKITRDWANEVDEFYAGKVVILLDMNWLGSETSASLPKLSLKELLQRGTQLETAKFENVFRQLSEQPEKVILVFDNLTIMLFLVFRHILDETVPNDVNQPMPVTSLFVKLVSGKLFRGATILAIVTLALRLNCPYLNVRFDREALMVT